MNEHPNISRLIFHKPITLKFVNVCVLTLFCEYEVYNVDKIPVFMMELNQASEKTWYNECQVDPNLQYHYLHTLRC